MNDADDRGGFAGRADVLGLQVNAAEAAALEEGVRAIGTLLAAVDDALRLPSDDPGSFMHVVRRWRQSHGG